MSLKRRHNLISLALILMCISVINSTMADHRRMHSSSCHTVTDNYGSDLYNGAYIRNYSDERISIYCPVPSDHNFRHFNLTRLNVHGYEASGQSNSARACNKDRDSSTVTCGPYKNWGSEYSGVYDIDTSAWTDFTGEHAFLIVRLDIGGYFYGYYLAD